MTEESAMATGPERRGDPAPARRRGVFGRKIAASLGAMVVLVVIVTVVSIIALGNVVDAKDRVIDANARLLVAATDLKVSAEVKSSVGRGFLLTADEGLLQQSATARDSFRRNLAAVRAAVTNEDGWRLTNAIETAEIDHQAGLDRVIALRRGTSDTDAVARAFEDLVVPPRERLTAAIDAFMAFETEQLATARQDASDTAARATAIIGLMAAVAVAVAVVLAIVLTRILRRQIGRTVSEVRSSSAELQATANQQATSNREQATAMSEITTTINELLATSRQIAESSQRVALVADQTAGAGRAGEETMARAAGSMAEIRSQVDLIVNHMLELGEKSQEIGAVLEIVSELADQTNILAINSTIEAVGAGEAGRRFAIVADEIRKLADRVAASTKDIRGLIEVVRSAVHTTVMVTETGSKAVDAGTRQFDEVTSSFRAIADLVVTTTEAAREIELSTKQQATAVEQVNVAVGDVAQVTREAEVSAVQTARTATQLSELSSDLQRLVDAQAER